MRIRYRRRFNRLDRLKELVIARALRLKSLDFEQTRPVVAIVGDLISDRIRVERVYEGEILETLRDCVLDRALCRSQVAIDVGANIGNHSMFLSDLFAKVIAFEPNPLTRSLLQLNLELNGIKNVDVRPIALSDRTGRETLTFNRRNIGEAHLGHSITGAAAESDSQTEVELAVGDEVVDFAESIGFIKVDVEGTEEEVLRGLENTIRRHGPVLMIEQLKDVIDPVSGRSPSFDFLLGLGYAALDIRPGRFLEGKLGRLASLLLGHTTYLLSPVKQLEHRTYSTLVFVPAASIQLN